MTPEVPRTDRPERLPAIRYSLKIGLGGLAAELIGGLETALDAEIIDRQYIQSAEREDQQHLDRPAPDTVDLDEAKNQFFVVKTPCLRARRDNSVTRLGSDVADGGDLVARETDRVQSRKMRCQHLARFGELLARIKRDEAAENRLGGAAVELLVRDGARQAFVGRPPQGAERARTDVADQPRHGAIDAGQMSFGGFEFVVKGWHGNPLRRSKQEGLVLNDKIVLVLARK
jgi:hypothetical protein